MGKKAKNKNKQTNQQAKQWFFLGYSDASNEGRIIKLLTGNGVCIKLFLVHEYALTFEDLI